MSALRGMPENVGERLRWLAGAPGFEPGNGGNQNPHVAPSSGSWPVARAWRAYAHSKSDILSAYCNAILGPAFASGLRGGGPSTLDIGNWSIVAIRQLVVPAAVLVLVRNACRISGDALFRVGALGSSAGRVVAHERLPDHAVNT